MSENPYLTLVLGGARSGKSAHGEGLIEKYPAPWTYIATAQAFDAEMRARIAAHRERRGDGWVTVEAPRELARAVSDAPAERAMLVDCLTLWLSNRLLAGADLAAERVELVAALRGRATPTVGRVRRGRPLHRARKRARPRLPRRGGGTASGGRAHFRPRRAHGRGLSADREGRNAALRFSGSLSISGGAPGKKLGGNGSFPEPLPPIADSRLAYV